MFSTMNYQYLALPPLPKTNVADKPVSHKEMYFAITEIECSILQEKLKAAMDAIVLDWNERHDNLVETINTLEQSKHNLEQKYHIQSQKYEKSIKEVQLYRSRYNNLLQRRYSQASTKSFSNFSFSSDPPSLISSPAIEKSLDSALFPKSDNEDFFDWSSILDGSNITSESTLQSPLSPQVECNTELLVKKTVEPEQEVLKFACSDGFWKAIAQGKSNKEEIDTLVSNYIRRGGSPNVAKNSETHKNVKEGYSLVHALVATKNTASLQLILQAGANPNVLPLTKHKQDKIPPLILAAKVGHLNSIRLLVEMAGAHLYNTHGPQDESVLHAAVQSDSEEVVSYLLKESQYKLLEKTDSVGATPVHYIAMEGKTRMLTYIAKDYPVKFDAQDNKGETPLHYAVRNRKIKMVIKLIELGANPNTYIPKQVPTPLDIAKAGGLDAITYQMKRLGAKTTKEMGRKSSEVTNYSSNSSIFSGESTGSSDVSTSGRSVRQYFQMKTSRIMKRK